MVRGSSFALVRGRNGVGMGPLAGQCRNSQWLFVRAGPSDHVGERSSLDQRCCEHLQLSGRGMAGSRVLGPLEAARGNVGGV